MIEAEVGREHEGPVVIGVIAEVIVSDRRLRRGGYEGGVRIDHPGRDVEAGVRDTPHADLTVVAFDILDQILDGVVGVATFVDLFARFAGPMGSHLVPLTFG